MPFWREVGKSVMPGGMLPHSVKKSFKKLGIGLGGGSKAGLEKFQTLNRKQKRTLDKLLGHISPGSFDIGKNSLYKTGASYLQDMLRSKFQPAYNAMDMLKDFEAPMMRQFREQILPSIAERFSGPGGQSSSAFQNALGDAGAGLQERLASLRGNLALQSQQDMGTQQANFLNSQLNAANIGGSYAQMPAQMSYQLAQLGLGTPAFGYQNRAGQPGFGQGMGQGFGQGIGQMLPSLIGGAIGTAVAPGVGTVVGAGMGNAVGQGMSGGGG